MENVTKKTIFIFVIFLLSSFYACKGQTIGIFSSPEKLLAKAAETGDIDLTRNALAKGADVNARIRYWEDDLWTPLSLTVYKGYIPEVEQESKRGMKGGHVNVASLLLEQGANVNVPTSHGMTPVMYAIGNIEMLTLLLDYGADIHATDDKGMTALAHAAKSARYYAAILLIKHGADITVKTNSGETLLSLASGGGNPKLVEYLIKRGLNVNAETQGGYTALMGAVDHTNWEVINLLLDYGADPNVELKYLDGETALMKAAGLGDPKAARILLDHGANVYGETGQKVLWRVLYGGRCLPEFIELLREYGVDTTGASCENDEE